MNGFVLRVIAMLTMLTDHIGWNFLERPMMLTWIGRVAFPLYAVLLADGFHCIHTDQDRLSRHLSTMLILAVVSEFGYDLMDERLVFSHYLDSQSNLITALENLPDEVTEFEESMWSDLVECMAVYTKDDFRFMLPCETEITA